MIFGDVPAAEVAGAILAHGVLVGTDRWSKGRRLSDADATAATTAGVATLTVARLESDDTGEDAAAAALAGALAGAGVVAAPAAHGRANLVARADGLLLVDRASIDAVNAVDEALTLGTLPGHARVAAGEVVATVKIIPYAVATDALARAVSVALPVAVAPFRPLDVVLIQTTVAGISRKMLAKTEAVTRARVETLGGRFTAAPPCPHATDPLTAALAEQPPGALLLVAGASAIADRSDVVPAAIVAAGGTVDRLGMPVDPGNLLCLGRLGERAVIGLPGCARSPKRNGFDWVLERIAAGIPPDPTDIARMGVGGLLPEAERPQPRVAASAGRAGAIILAAGRSTRMGGANKLIADLDGKPVVAHVVDAVAAAGLPSPVIVTGHMGDAVRAGVGNRPAVFVEAEDFAEGMSRSLRAALRAVPSSWTAVLVCLGDMPRVAPSTLAALAAEAGSSAVVAPVCDGKRGNPLLWGRAHFPALMALDGDIGGKALLAGVDVVEVAVKDPFIFADVDTPEALEALRDQIRHPGTGRDVDSKMRLNSADDASAEV